MKNSFTAAAMPVTYSLTGALAKACASDNGKDAVPSVPNQPPLPPSCDCVSLSGKAHRTDCPVASGDTRRLSPFQGGLPIGDSRLVNLPELLSLIHRTLAFQAEKFPARTVDSMLTHLAKETGELRDCHGQDEHEWADVLLLLIGAAALKGLTLSDLVCFAHEKLSINAQRQWHPPDAHGCYHHIKP